MNKQQIDLFLQVCLFALLLTPVVIFADSNQQVSLSSSRSVVDSPHQRVSCARTRGPVTEAHHALGAGFFLNYHGAAQSVTPRQGSDVIPQVHSLHVGPDMDFDEVKARIDALIREDLGSVWLVGNEIDRFGQDGMLPELYPPIYHELYHYIKAADSTARVGNASVVQPTPLRLEYLDRVWDAYIEQYGTEMPVDLWNVHNMILREERGRWGASIPPGIEADRGMLYEIEDNNNVEIFKTQLIAFRQWMADKGQRDKPLYVSEYGILMPEDYGFGVPVVNQFISKTFDFMLHATDEEIGYSADGDRLVQWWTWYSCDDIKYDEVSQAGFNGNLVDHETAQMTETGEHFQRYLAADLTVASHLISYPERLNQAGYIEAVVVNQGLRPTASAFDVQLWHGHPQYSGTLLATSQVEASLPVMMYGAMQATIRFDVAQTELLNGPLYLWVDSKQAVFEFTEENNIYSIKSFIFIPIVTN